MNKNDSKPPSSKEDFPNPSTSAPIFRMGVDERAEARLFNFHAMESYGGVKFRWSMPVAMIRLALPEDNYFIRLNTGGIRGDLLSLSINIIWNKWRVPEAAISVADGQIGFHVLRRNCVTEFDQRLILIVEPLRASAPETRKLGLPIIDLEVWSAEAPLARMSRSAPNATVGNRLSDVWRRSKLTYPDWMLAGILEASFLSLGRFPLAVHCETLPADCDTAIVSHTEINSRHGTGVLLQHMFPDMDRVAVLESTRYYGRERVSAGVTFELPSQLSRPDVYRCLLDWFGNSPPKRAFVVPYLEADLWMAVALRDLYGTNLVLHVMDDNTLYEQGISSALMEEAIEKSDVRFAISPEMRSAYEQRFGQKFYLLPPVVPQPLIDLPHEPDVATSDRGVMIGNLWSPEWGERLVSTVRHSGLKIDWFCNNPEAPWVVANRKSLAEAGVFIRDPIWQEELVRELRRYPFLLLPTGDPSDRFGRAIAKLSLPSRAVLHATAVKTPILVVGSGDTAVAGFVKSFQLGAVVPYQPDLLRDAATRLNNSIEKLRIHNVGSNLSEHFSALDIQQWIWSSMEKGHPADDRFESLFPQNAGLNHYISPAAPRGIHWAEHPAWQLLKRYALYGGTPRTILDVGASNGRWSYLASSVFPNSHFVLFEPLFQRYPANERGYHLNELASYDVIEKIVTNRSGSAKLLVAESLFGSSLLSVEDVHGSQTELTMICETLDKLEAQHHWQGPILLKADVQFAEHLVLEGATDLLRSKIDAVFLELSFERGHKKAKTYAEMVELMAELGFGRFDEAEGWRNPTSGQIEQMDVLFVRRSAN